MGGALDGLLVVDLSRILAGPYCTQMLGDHGAEVIKVEPPDGDGTRQWGESYGDGVSAYYAGLNRNKRHIGVDLATAAGRALVLRMLEDADVLVENFKPGTMERWGSAPRRSWTGFRAWSTAGSAPSGPTGRWPGCPATTRSSRRTPASCT
ncbi:hypothetical protein Psuf_071640 [Phytohabitans suffuscus]|uniref:CoA transferase n=1 Tax=Phytohabitans suffuscus TaxID=624315 RepID=A0A6F8YVH6_9ACTN|nr:hypothetical protein Psuf_071640 [Phytohabitans suffuscus]